ncbi:MAG: hypothetical protein ACP5I4_11410 [Oceanipulchritudo sp.]
MPNHRSDGFILPFALILSSAILVLAVLMVAQDGRFLSSRGQEVLRKRAESLLRLNVNPLIRQLNGRLNGEAACSALKAIDDGPPELRRPVLVGAAEEETFLHAPEEGLGRVRFSSPVSGFFLYAGKTVLSPSESPMQLTLSWAGEDIALSAPWESPFPAWPFPSWLHAPAQEEPSLAELLGDSTHADLAGLPWIPAGDALPYREDAAPALVPVVTWVGLRFGIFASGVSGSREKTVRIRYYLEGNLWNPYNRPLRLHEGEGLEPLFRLVLIHLPQIRIHNLSRGISSSWIPLDEAINSQSGARGIEAWIRTPGRMEAGAGLPFREPDGAGQPEGLARTLHGGFAVGPADRVRIEFKPAEKGPAAVCLSLAEGDPLQAAANGSGWFRLEGPVGEPSTLDFARADDQPAPFYLEEGSLAFRESNAQVQLILERPPPTLAGSVDPRRTGIRAGSAFVDAEDRMVEEGDLMVREIRDLRKDSPRFPEHPGSPALFSWPAQAPPSLLAASDLPVWSEGFRIGSPNAVRINRLLDSEGVKAAGEPAYKPAWAINMLPEAGWQQLLAASGIQAQAENGGWRFGAYPVTSPDQPLDFRDWTTDSLNRAAEYLSMAISTKPCSSISDFFNRGLMGKAFSEAIPGDPLHSLMPLRGWLKQAPPIRRRGASWILHLLVEGSLNRHFIRRSARVWLLESADPDRPSGWEIIRFEWTDPRLHCPPLPR